LLILLDLALPALLAVQSGCGQIPDDDFLVRGDARHGLVTGCVDPPTLAAKAPMAARMARQK